LFLAPLEVFPQGGTQTRNARCLLVGFAWSDHGTVGQLLARLLRRGAPETAAAMLAPQVPIWQGSARFLAMPHIKPTWATAAAQK
jgi:hypothetical protein